MPNLIYSGLKLEGKKQDYIEAADEIVKKVDAEPSVKAIHFGAVETLQSSPQILFKRTGKNVLIVEIRSGSLRQRIILRTTNRDKMTELIKEMFLQNI